MYNVVVGGGLRKTEIGKQGKQPEQAHQAPSVIKDVTTERGTEAKKKAEEAAVKDRFDKKKEFEARLEDLHRVSNKAIRIADSMGKSVDDLHKLVERLLQMESVPGSLQMDLDSKRRELTIRETLMQGLKDRQAKGEIGLDGKIAIVESQIKEMKEGMTEKPRKIAEAWKEVTAMHERRRGLLMKIEGTWKEVSDLGVDIGNKKGTVQGMAREIEDAALSGKAGRILGEAILALTTIESQKKKTSEEMKVIARDMQGLKSSRQ